MIEEGQKNLLRARIYDHIKVGKLPEVVVMFKQQWKPRVKPRVPFNVVVARILLNVMQFDKENGPEIC